MLTRIELPKDLPPYTRAYIDARGKLRIEFRPPTRLKELGCKACKLEGRPGEPEFEAAYHKALADIAPSIKPVGGAGSLDELRERFYKSEFFAQRYKSTFTSSRRMKALDEFCQKHGHRPAATLPADFLRQKFAEIENPYAKQGWLKAMRGLMAYAIAKNIRSDDPTLGLKAPRIKTDGYQPWQDDEVDQYRAFHPYGTQARLAMELAYEASARRGDVCVLGPQNIRNGRLEFKQIKTGGLVSIPLTPELKAAIEAYKPPRSATTFLQTVYGNERAAVSMSKRFATWREQAGLPEGLSLHGLRKASLRFSAEAGGTDHELMALSGHKTPAELHHYTEDANRKRMADALAQKRAAANAKRRPKVVAFPVRQSANAAMYLTGKKRV